MGYSLPVASRSVPFVSFVLLGVACASSQASAPAAPPQPKVSRLPPPNHGTEVIDECAELPGQPPPKPLRAPFEGLAKAARCEREVYTIMGGVTHFLGVSCAHCHLEPDYAADTHNKQIANWMARELAPRLRRASAGAEPVWCQDCHAGSPKLLGNPRQREVAIEWMTTHLSSFDTTLGKPARCRDCHVGDLGTPEFRTRIILGELGGLPVAGAAPPKGP